jgi:hypothetical protein
MDHQELARHTPREAWLAASSMMRPGPKKEENRMAWSIKREDAINALKKMDPVIDSLTPGTIYTVLHSGNRYPPKELIRYSYDNPDESENDEIAGFDATQAGRWLVKNDFCYVRIEPFNELLDRLKSEVQSIDKDADLQTSIRLIEQYKKALISVFWVEDPERLDINAVRSLADGRFPSGFVLAENAAVLAENIDSMKKILAQLKDETKRIDQRVDWAVERLDSIVGEERALQITASILMLHPGGRYGQWRPGFERLMTTNEVLVNPIAERSPGVRYALTNEVLQTLAKEAKIDMWRIDMLLSGLKASLTSNGSSKSEDNSLISSKGQIILYGPPGTGKTFTTRSISVEVIGEMESSKVYEEYERLTKSRRIEFITFHPSYSYEEFVEGISVDLDHKEKGDAEGASHIRYILKDGVFKSIAMRALVAALDLDASERQYSMQDLIDKYRGVIAERTQAAGDKGVALKAFWDDAPRFVLVIDEINRGDISKIFGELITLLEMDKRLGMTNELIVRLPYSKSEFAVPPNLFVIGTMNTADKSIALLDVALRRRFAFVEMAPNLELIRTELIGNSEIELKEETERALDKSIVALEKINGRIASDHTIGRDKRIGHSFLFKVRKRDDVLLVWNYEIFPLLEEYCYSNIKKLSGILFNVEINQYVGVETGLVRPTTVEDLEILLDTIGKS